ncbi:TIGR03750 family conjugal transfer protein [Acidovorax sp. SUPP2522]|uniref:TIGR03750 family conjugal transfer protein n=1 Tax=Acidovorax sp. SUPP2522 TaxID=511900 RepID=UPI0024E0D4D4|nr:TIGR03750 family conjugal transfer protein [Acidovorax sp. SUPP2522]
MPRTPDSHPDAPQHFAASRGAPLTAHVNVEPSIFNGMTTTEAKVIAAAALAACLFMGAIVTAFTGLWQVMLMLAIFGPMAVLWFSSTWLARIKRGRPDGYYTQYLHLWAARRGWVRCRFIGHEGWWDLGRSFEGSLASSLRPPREVRRDSHGQSHADTHHRPD